MEHLYPPYAGTERETLVGYLDWYRELMIDKASGLTRDQANTRLMPSTLTLIGLIHHLAYVEHWWFHEFFKGNDALEPWASADWANSPDWELDVASELEPDQAIERYRTAFETSQRIISGTESLEQLSVMDRNGEHRSLRWILAHMIEETARHAGHADLIRESIDGEVGDFREQS